MRKKVVFLPYDMDTAIGINNEGELGLGYSYEDTDHISGTVNLIPDGALIDGERIDSNGDNIEDANTMRSLEIAVEANHEYTVQDTLEAVESIEIYLANADDTQSNLLTPSGTSYTFTTPAWAAKAYVNFVFGEGAVHNPMGISMTTIQANADIFNGQDSVLWNNLRDTFGEELAAMYKSVRSAGVISYENVEQMFEEHQAVWPEALFNEDAKFKYLDPLEEDGDATYLPMLQGSKAEQRKWWLYNRFRYEDSKYNAGDSLTDYIQLRGYAKGNITLTPYADIYPSIKFGSYLVQQRGERGHEYEIVCPLDRLNDTEIYIYNASSLSSVGDLSPLKVGLADFSRATKLQEIKLGDSAVGYNNGNLKSLNVGNNTLLKKIDVRNCTGLGIDIPGGRVSDKNVNLSGCVGLEEAYFDGTNLQSVSFANGGALMKLHLPGTITNLTLRNLGNLTEFVCPNFSHITTLWLENPSSVINTAAIVEAMPAKSRIRLYNFHWELEGLGDVIAMFDLLDDMTGLDQNGNNTEHVQVYGTIHVQTATTIQINAIRNRYPDVTVTYDTLVPTLVYKNEDGSQTMYYEAVRIGTNGTKLLPDAKEHDVQYSYTPYGWSLTAGGEADANALVNIQSDRTVYAVYSKTLMSYEITFRRGEDDGDDILKTVTVNYGEMPSYGTGTPVSSRGATYAFYNWSPDIVAVTGPATYTAVFRAPVTLTYYDYDGALLHEEEVAYGGNGTWSGTPTRASTAQYSYTFGGWSLTQGGAASTSSRQNITANRDVYATYTQTIMKYTINFVKDSTDGGGTLQSETLEYGTMPSYKGTTPTTTRTGDFAFNGWDSEITPVTENKTYTAVFKDMSGPLIKYLKGTMTEYESDTATKVAEYAFDSMRTLTSVKTTATTIEQYAFSFCSNLTVVDLTSQTGAISIAANAFANCSKLTAIFIRSSQVATLANTDAFSSTIFITGEAAIYVPANLVDSYKAASNWSTFADRIYPIEAHPVTNFDTIQDDWTTIITNVNNGTATYHIGDSKSIDLGSEGKIKMVIIGENKDELADESGNTARYTWWSKIMPKNKKRMNPTLSNNTEGTGSIGGWEHTEMHDYLAENGTIWNSLPTALQTGIKAVKKYTRIFDTSGTAVNDVVTADKLFLLSVREVGFTNNPETQGPVYSDYFTSNTTRIAYLNTGSASYWWLRSANSASNFACVGNYGSWYINGVGSSYGVGFGYCT